MSIKKHHIVYSLILGTFFSCVPAKKYEELKSKQEACKTENAALKTQNQNLEEEVKDLANALERLKKEKTTLEKDNALLQSSYNQMKNNYENISDTYELLLNRNKEFALEFDEDDSLSKLIYRNSVYLAIIFSIFTFGGGEQNFIYFQF